MAAVLLYVGEGGAEEAAEPVMVQQQTNRRINQTTSQARSSARIILEL